MTGQGSAESLLPHILEQAQQDNLLSSTGMTPQGAVQLLDQNGISSHLEQGNISELEQALSQGKDIIVGIDAYDLPAWQQDGAPTNAPQEANHGVMVTGIDETAGVVYINDTGIPGGAEEAVPIKDFLEAWQTSQNAMIVTDGVHTDATPSPAPAPSTNTSTTTTDHTGPTPDTVSPPSPNTNTEHSPGAIILPVILHIERDLQQDQRELQ